MKKFLRLLQFGAPTFDTEYGGGIFEKNAAQSRLAGKSNAPKLKQRCIKSTKDGSKILLQKCKNMFGNVGDCNERPKWN